MPDTLAHPNWEEWLNALGRATPPDRVIENALHWLLERTGAQTAFLILPDARGEWIDIAYAAGVEAETLKGLRLRPTETLLEPTLTLGTTWWYETATSQTTSITLRKPLGGIRTGLAVPLPGIPLSALGVLNRAEPFAETERQVLELLAPLLSVLARYQDSYAHEQTQARMLTWFTQLPHLIGADPSLQNALNTVASAMRALGSAGGGIWIYNDERTVLLNAIRFGASPLPDVLLDLELPQGWDARPCEMVRDGRALVVAPLRLAEQKVLGFASLTLPLEEPTPAEWLEAIGGHFALALHHALLYEQTTRRARQLSQLYELSLKLGETYTPLEVLNEVVVAARELVPHDVAVIYVPDPQDAERLLPTLVMPANDALWNHFPHRQHSLPGYVYSFATPLSAPDLSENPHNRKEPLPSQFISALAVPLQVADRIYGVLMLLTETPRDFALAEAELLFTLANTGALRLHDLRQRIHA